MGNLKTIFPCRFKDMKGRLISIRVYDESDYSGLLLMYDNYEPKGLEAGLPPTSEKIKQEWLKQVESCFFNIVAIHKGQIIGHAALDTTDKQGYQEYLIFVKQGYRHCGIGTKLSRLVKQAAKVLGCRKVWLSVRTGNAIAIRVFKKVGFKFIGKIDIQRDMELVINDDRDKP